MDEFEQTDALLRLVFTAVLNVSLDGRITQAEILEDQFGIKISTLVDLPTQDTNERLSDELGDLMAGVHRMRQPTKRKVMIRSRGGSAPW